MKLATVIPILVFVCIAISVSVLLASFYNQEPSRVAGFSAYDKIETIEKVRAMPGYENVRAPSYVPDGFDIGPLIYQGKGDEHHSLHLFYGSTSSSYEEIRESGFDLVFTDTSNPRWEEKIKETHDNYNTVNGTTVAYYYSGLHYGGEPQSVSIKSNSLELEEMEKILRSVIDK